MILICLCISALHMISPKIKFSMSNNKCLGYSLYMYCTVLYEQTGFFICKVDNRETDLSARTVDVFCPGVNM